MVKEIIKCEHCGIEFSKSSREVRRSIKLGRKQFCSMSCSKKDISNLEHLSKIRTRDTSHLNCRNRIDEYSMFKTHFRRIQTRNKDFELSLQDMLDVWNIQKGICIYSKVKLKECVRNGYNDPIHTLSIDRIDSSKGYTKDNIQFISIAMNHMKNNMTHEQTLQLIEILKNNT